MAKICIAGLEVSIQLMSPASGDAQPLSEAQRHAIQFPFN